MITRDCFLLASCICFNILISRTGSFMTSEQAKGESLGRASRKNAFARGGGKSDVPLRRLQHLRRKMNNVAHKVMDIRAPHSVAVPVSSEFMLIPKAARNMASRVASSTKR